MNVVSLWWVFDCLSAREEQRSHLLSLCYHNCSLREVMCGMFPRHQRDCYAYCSILVPASAWNVIYFVIFDVRVNTLFITHDIYDSRYHITVKWKTAALRFCARNEVCWYVRWPLPTPPPNPLTTPPPPSSLILWQCRYCSICGFFPLTSKAWKSGRSWNW